MGVEAVKEPSGARLAAPVPLAALPTILCSALWSVECRAIAIPNDDATSSHALDDAEVEVFEDLMSHAKSFQPPERE